MLRLWQPDKRLQIQRENFASLCSWEESLENTGEGTSVCCLTCERTAPFSPYLADSTFVPSSAAALLLGSCSSRCPFIPWQGADLSFHTTDCSAWYQAKGVGRAKLPWFRGLPSCCCVQPVVAQKWEKTQPPEAPADTQLLSQPSKWSFYCK